MCRRSSVDQPAEVEGSVQPLLIVEGLELVLDWCARPTRHSSDALLDHVRLREAGVVSVVSPRSGGSRIDLLGWTVA